jgi:hypothetical protein
MLSHQYEHFSQGSSTRTESEAFFSASCGIAGRETETGDVKERRGF